LLCRLERQLSSGKEGMSQLFRVLYDFDAEEDGEMSISAGDVVKVLPQVGNFYRICDLTNESRNLMTDGMILETVGSLFKQPEMGILVMFQSII
jgi:hypothetical protein